MMRSEECERISVSSEHKLMVAERRKRLRLPLHWDVYLVVPGADCRERTVTQDLSLDGFYCIVNEALTAGERIECEIVIPAHLPDRNVALSLRCRARVVRVEQVDDEDRYGLACRIEDYHVMGAS
jgi:hypothetical protein